MTDKETIRHLFAERLHAALDHLNIREHGRGADIRRQLKTKGIVKTAQAVSKWLNGGAIPELDSLTALSEWLGVRREWLEHGVKPVFPDGTTDLTDSKTSAPPRPGTTLKMVPLISWEQATTWLSAPNFSTADAETWLACPASISKSGFALRVHGDSMTSHGPGRSYPNGSIIFIDPEISPSNGDRVIATLQNSSEATFKVLVSDAGKQYLKPINPQYPIIEVTDHTTLNGKVVGMFIFE